MYLRLVLVVALMLLGPAAGAYGGSGVPTATGLASAHRSTNGRIQHVVFIIQEGRSFNNLFMGFKGARTEHHGYDANGNKVELKPLPLAQKWGIDHYAAAYVTDYDNGKLDGWNNENACCGQPRDFAYSYVQKSDSKKYWDMAEQYVLADDFFPSNFDGTFISHQYTIAGYANDEVNFPDGVWSCQGGPNDVIGTFSAGMVPVCQDYSTLGDELDKASLTWRYYVDAGNGSLYDAYAVIDHIYFGSDYAQDVVHPPSQFITDVGNGNLAAVSWVTPTYSNSDDPGNDSASGPGWVASVVNAVGQSTYWDSTAIFIMWDDWGGWFDPVPPVPLDFDGSGFRVPLIGISAYAKSGYVSHVQYATSSVLRFIEDTFGLGQLAASDARAADPGPDFFDFNKKPRRFKAFDATPQRSEDRGRSPRRLFGGN